jgi:hypothetical protein
MAIPEGHCPAGMEAANRFWDCALARLKAVIEAGFGNRPESPRDSRASADCRIWNPDGPASNAH